MNIFNHKGRIPVADGQYRLAIPGSCALFKTKEVMTQEEKARAYDEALKRAKAAIDIAADKDLVKGVATTIFPQLRESEDERIRKHLIEIVETYWGKTNEPGKAADLAYLEKQKERKHYWKPTETDVALFNKAVTTNKTLTPTERAQLDIIRSKFGCCRATTCNGIVQKEQKPVDFPTTDEEVKEFLETHPKVEVPEKYKTPDFVFSKQEYESHPIISKDTTSVKPAEWSEEDRLHYANVLEALEYVKGCKSDYDKIEAVKSDIAWLKLLRNRVGKDSLQPHWKPSEEQMGALSWMLENARGNIDFDPLKELYEQLKKL